MFSNKDGIRKRVKKVSFELLLVIILVSLAVQANVLVLKEPQNKYGPKNNIIPTIRQKLQSTNPSDFISTWKTTNPGTSNASQISLPLQSSGTYNFLVDWGDGTNNTITAYNQSEVTHTYSFSGIYNVTINGTIKGWDFNNAGDVQKIIGISQWGSLNLGNSGNYFLGAINLQLNATDAPDLNGTTNFAGAFDGCSSLGNLGNMSNWNVSAVTNMADMFAGASSFNQPISSWDVSHVTTMYEMFYGDSAFNQSIGSWNVSAVTTMFSMFAGATAFNQPIGSWNVSTVTNMQGMFFGAVSFNQPIDSWKVSAVTTMFEMFYQASSFNQPLDSWNVSHVITMRSMFQYSSFNQLIDSWYVSAVTTMAYMFSGASSFNQPLNNWNVSSVQDMSYMFAGASSFNQPISSWDVSHVRIMQNMFTGAGLSTQNYNNLLIDWSQLNLLPWVTFDAGNSRYSSFDAYNARLYMINTFHWNITDGGLDNITSPSSPNLQITAGNQFLYLNWSAPNDGGSPITSYQVFRGTTSGTYTYVADTVNSFFNDTTVQLNTLYYYTVKATNSQGNSPYSNEVSATTVGTLPPVPTVPSAPTLQVEAGNQSVYLSWTAPNNGGSPILEYQIFRGVISGQYSFVGVTSHLYFNDTMLSGGTTYDYMVAAINAIGEGNDSQQLSVTPYGPSSNVQKVTQTIIQTSTETSTVSSPPTTVTASGNTVATSGTETNQTTSSSKGKTSPGFELLPLFFAFALISLGILIRKHKKK